MTTGSYSAKIARVAWETAQKYWEKNGKEAHFSSPRLHRLNKNFNGYGLVKLESAGVVDWTGHKEGGVKVYKLGERMAGLGTQELLALDYGKAMMRAAARA